MRGNKEKVNIKRKKRHRTMKRIFTIFMTMVMLLGMTQVAMAAEKNPDAFQAAVDVLKGDQQEEETERLPKVEPTEYIPVLMYHHFAVRDMGFGDGITTMQSELEEQIRYFKEQGYTIISMEELDQILAKEEKEKDADGDIGLDMKVKYLCITMDDGYYSNYDLAYPIFQKYNVPATIFVVTDYITNQIGLKKFTWSNAAEMLNNSKVGIYNHTSNHVPASKTTTEEFVAAALAGEEALEANLPTRKTTVKALAYPNGQNTPELQQALLDEGFSLLFTIEPGVINRNTSRGAIPRIMVSSGMTGADIVARIEQTAARTMGS